MRFSNGDQAQGKRARRRRILSPYRSLMHDVLLQARCYLVSHEIGNSIEIGTRRGSGLYSLPLFSCQVCYMELPFVAHKIFFLPLAPDSAADSASRKHPALAALDASIRTRKLSNTGNELAGVSKPRTKIYYSNKR